MVVRLGQGRATHDRLGSWPFSCDANLQVPSFGEKLPWYFSSILFPAKTNRKKTFSKNIARLCSFIQIW
jgi:hypothetical protein